MAVNGFSSIYQSFPRQSLLRKLSSFRLDNIDNKRRADSMAPDIMSEKELLQIFVQVLKSFCPEGSYSKGAYGVRDSVSTFLPYNKPASSFALYTNYTNKQKPIEESKPKKEYTVQYDSSPYFNKENKIEDSDCDEDSHQSNAFANQSVEEENKTTQNFANGKDYKSPYEQQLPVKVQKKETNFIKQNIQNAWTKGKNIIAAKSD